MDTLLGELKWVYRQSDAADLVPTSVPGYWEHKTPCPGGCMPMAHRQPMQHTISFFDAQRDRQSGQWRTPYQTWRRHREAFECDPEHYDLVALEQQ